MPLTAARSDASAFDSYRTAKDRVLVVDDEPQVLLAIQDLLCDEFSVSTAESGSTALQLVQQEPDFAVVISDQRMPKMTGDELLERVQDVSSASRVLFTGFADLTAVIRAVNHGKIFAYVTKPWQSDDLRMMVRKAVEHFRLTQDLSYERQLLHDLMSNTPDAICFKDRELRYLRVNRAYEAFTVGALHALPANQKRLSESLPDCPIARSIEAEQAEVVRRGLPVTDQIREFSVDGVPQWMSTSYAPIRGARGELRGLVGISRDVTQRVGTEQRLARLTRIHEMLSGINAAIVRIKDRELLLKESCRIAVQNGRLTLALAVTAPCDARAGQVVALEGHVQESSLAERLLALISSSTDTGQALAQGESVIVNAVGEENANSLPQALLPADCAAYALFPLQVNGQLDSVFALFATQAHFFDAQEIDLLSGLADNISLALDHGAQRQRLDFLAYHDELTNLPKRDLLIDRIDQLLAAQSSLPRPLALILLDISRFRHINDSLGRRGGDALLLSVVKRLKANSPPHATLARFDSHTFALLMPRVDDESDVASAVENALLPAFREAFQIDTTELHVSCTIGIALAPSDGRDADTLIRNAASALKQIGTNAQRYMFYAQGMTERATSKLALENKLRRALERNEFVLHYQPKVELTTGRVVGLEALIRWQDPEVGLVPPNHFIPLLEESGLIIEVGRWVLERAAAQFTEWSELGIEPPPIAVNVSAIQLGQAGFLNTIDEAMLRYPKINGGIDIEITESVLVEDFAGNVDKLKAVRKKGLRVAIDDFGTGYSSLGYLSRLPVDALKVDRSFVMRMIDDPQNKTIVMTIISLAHALDLKVIAEGAETIPEAQLLRSLECDQVQGYVFARPQRADSIAPLLTTRLLLDAPQLS